MTPLGAVTNNASMAADYGLANAQRRKPEEEPAFSRAEANEQAQPPRPARLPREPEPELTSPSRAEVPAMLQGVVSQIAASSQWKLAELQPVSSRAKLVSPAYV